MAHCYFFGDCTEERGIWFRRRFRGDLNVLLSNKYNVEMDLRVKIMS